MNNGGSKMTRIFSIILILIVSLSSISGAAIKKKSYKAKKIKVSKKTKVIIKAKPKPIKVYIPSAPVIPVPVSYVPAPVAVSAIEPIAPPQKKSGFSVFATGGLAGGGARVGILGGSKINNSLSWDGGIGYAIGNEYTLVTLGGTIKYPLRGNIYAGVGLDYSSYSFPVLLSGGLKVAETSGIGFDLLIGTDINEKIFLQAGYGTRLGIIAEVGYRLK